MTKIWTEESIKKFRKLLEDSESESHQSDLKEAWNKLKETIKRDNTTQKKKTTKKRKIGEKGGTKNA